MSIKGARGVLLNITGDKNLGLHEISQAASVIYDQAHEDAVIILGSVIDETMGDEVSVTIIATGFSVEDHVEFAAEVAAAKLQSMYAVPKIIGSVRDVSVLSPAPDDCVQKAVIQTQEAETSYKTHPEDVHEDVHKDNETNDEHADMAAAKEQAAKDLAAHESQFVDMNDLDVPAFLRKDARAEK